MVESYFSNRLTYADRDGSVYERGVDRDVSQGSILSRLLWNIAYDEVLRTALPAGCNVICYADDTIVIAGGRTWREAVNRAGLAVACVVRTICVVDLRMASRKPRLSFSMMALGGSLRRNTSWWRRLGSLSVSR